jgi:hypothetical protein
MGNTELLAKVAALPADLKKEAEMYIQFLVTKKADQPQERIPGLANGLIEMHDDFDAPLEDFKDYQ